MLLEYDTLQLHPRSGLSGDMRLEAGVGVVKVPLKHRPVTKRPQSSFARSLNFSGVIKQPCFGRAMSCTSVYSSLLQACDTFGLVKHITHSIGSSMSIEVEGY